MDVFKPPAPLSDYEVKTWNLWKQKFAIYMKASNKEKESEEIKIAILLNCIGDEGLDVYNTFQQDQKSTLEKLLQAYDEYFLPKRIIPMETFKFHNLVQTESQSIEQYVTELKKQAKVCEFVCKNPACKTSYEDRMIRDRLIVGLRDKEVQSRLIRETDIDVSKIVDYCKSIKLSKEHLKTLHSEDTRQDITVDAVREQQKIKCNRCLYEHYKNKCPAYRKTCAACQKIGHFAKACYTNQKDQNSMKQVKEEPKIRKEDNKKQEKNVMQIQEEQSGQEELFLNECTSGLKQSWYEKIIVQGVEVMFKLDTGSDCSILPKQVIHRIDSSIVIKSCSTTLVSYGNFKFKPVGEVILTCVYKDLKKNVKFTVVDLDTEPLFGINECLSFNLVQRIYSIDALPNAKEKIYDMYNSVFIGTGKIPGKVSIELTDDAKPVIQYQRKVPLSLHEKLKQTLDSLETKNIIQKVDYPTNWVNSLMIVEKPDKSLRLCIDPKPLNQYIRREHFLIPTANDILSRLTGKTIFSVIDMKEGFYQLELDDKSADLCVFNSPFGRYRFNRLPFGIKSAPEIFSRKCFEIFGDIPGVEIYFDDLIISGTDEVSHDIALKEVFNRALKNCIKFNFQKFQYKLNKVVFMGQIITDKGVTPDLENIKAITAIESPKNKNEVLRILGMLKFFAKYIPNLSQLTSKLRELTKKDSMFSWTKEHELELQSLKLLVTKAPVLKIFDPNLPIVVQCDASSEGLGCCLLQSGHAVSFASRCLSKSEKRWAQIEKELAAIVFAFEKFHNFLYGFEVTVQTDHKPLIPIFSKHLDNVSARLQRMLLKLLKYKINVTYLPGKDMVIADTLSRSYIKDPVEDDPDMEYVVHALCNNIPMSEEKKMIFKKEINSDPCLSQVKEFCRTFWPDNDRNLSHEMRLFYKLKEEIYLSNDLLFMGSKIIVPKALQNEMLKLIHEPHFGIEKSKRRARQVLYWHNMSKQIEDYISKCEICQTNKRSLQKETLMSHDIPKRNWQYIFSDFFEYNGKNYILIVDAYSNWLEVEQTKGKTANDVIKFCISKFSQFGVPDKFFADNVPYNSREFKNFANEWNFECVFSSPHHHQSNGLAEKYVGIVKNMLRKCKTENDLSLFIMEYHTTPIPQMDYSPAQLFLNRVLKTKIPISENALEQTIIDSREIQDKLHIKQNKQKFYYDRNAKDLPKLEAGENILMQSGKSWLKGKVTSIVNDRSYIVEDFNGNSFRRNRRFLSKSKLEPEENSILYDHSLDSGLETFLTNEQVSDDTSIDININVRDNQLCNNGCTADDQISIASSNIDCNSISSSSSGTYNLDDNDLNALLNNDNIEVIDMDLTDEHQLSNIKRKRTRPKFLEDFVTI